jgi:diguanylate cyclase
MLPGRASWLFTNFGIAQAAGLIGAMSGGLVLVGWATDTELLRTVLPGGPSLNPVTAAGILSLGLSLYVAASGRDAWRRMIWRGGGVIVATVGALRLCHLILGWQTGVDQLLFRDQMLAVAAGTSARMAFPTALNFLLFGGVLVLLDYPIVGSRYAMKLMLTGGAFGSLLPIFGHLYGVRSFYAGGMSPPMPLWTAIVFVILTIGLVFARPERGLGFFITDAGVAGVTARRLLPAAIVIPAALGWVTLKGYRGGFYNVEMGVALFVLASTVVFTALVGRNVQLLWQIGSELDEARDAAVASARRDALTDLPNRLLFNDLATQAITWARRHNTRLAILFLDLDRFKQVNDSLGHSVGDLLLQSVAGRLRGCVRSSDAVGRQGGDEFLVLLSELSHAQAAGVLAHKIIAALAVPHQIGRHQLHITATIGIGVYPEDGEDAEALVTCADTAMYHAKARGKNKYQFFEARMNALVVERQAIETGLHRALATGEFVLHYQPKLDLTTGAITGAEALVRWNHPDRGLLFPGAFVTVAEDCGLIVPIGRWVLREACRQAQEWITQGRNPLAVAVNISAVEFREPHFLARVRAALSDTGLDPRYLELELTESALLQHVDSTAIVLDALRDLGVAIAIDDFGTGYSSLSYLRQFPANVLKIDQSFVQEIGRHPSGTSIVCAVISMAKSLGHRVIAEGIETLDQLTFLQAQGCTEGQGYYFSHPLDVEQFVRLPHLGMPDRVVGAHACR